MRFLIAGHAALVVESEGATLLIDPWIIGSCYWRSWWNFPEIDPAALAGLKPTHVYLTHLHWDHFQSASLKKFCKGAKVLIPDTSAGRFVRDLRACGFPDVTTVPHGGSATLAGAFKLTSYQFGTGVDSAVVLEDATSKLLNLNDAKVFGSSLAQIVARHESFTFVFRSHANASGLPFCVEDYETMGLTSLDPKAYAEEFALSCLAVPARYAVPFASNHCFLHKETLKYNKLSTDPELAFQAFQENRAKFGSAAECVVMPPGSSWDDKSGFHVRPFAYKDKDRYIAELARKHQEKLAATYQEEAEVAPDAASFGRYFKGFLGAVPGFLRRRLPPTVAFRSMGDAKTESWVVDFAHARVTTEPGAAPARPAVEISCHAAVLRDCSRKRLFSVWTASKRLSIRLAGAAELKRVALFFALLDAYELDMLPLKKLTSAANAVRMVKRWREWASYVGLVLAVKVLRRQPSLRQAYRASLEAMARRTAERGR